MGDAAPSCPLQAGVPSVTQALAPGQLGSCTLRRPGGGAQRGPDPEKPLGLCRPRQRGSQWDPVILATSWGLGHCNPAGRQSPPPQTESPEGGTVARAPAGPQCQRLMRVFVVLS